MTLLGRDAFVDELGALLELGATVMLIGPVGAGKTAIIEALMVYAQERSIACGVAPRTSTVADLRQALSRAFPDVDSSGPARVVRARLRRAAEATPVFLLLDQLGRTGSAFKGELKALRGAKTGVLLAADVDHPRDHARVRSLRLTHREIAVPRLHTTTIRTLLKRECENLPHPLDDDDARAVATSAEGLPGRAIFVARALAHTEAWRGGRPRIAWLLMNATIDAAERYR